MNVLIVNPILHTPADGIIVRRPTNRHTMIYGLCRGFVSRGHRVTLLASADYRPLEPETAEGFETVYFPSSMPRLFKPTLLPRMSGLSGWLRRHGADYDLIVCSELFMLSTLTAVRRCRGKVLVWNEQAKYQRMMHGLPAKLWFNVVVPLAMPGVAVVGRSAGARQFVGRFCRNVIPFVIDHGVDNDIFVPTDRTEDCFAYVGQMIKRKRPEYILARFAEFVSRPGCGHFRLRMVGDGPELENLKKQAAELGVDDRVEFAGFRYSWEWVPMLGGCVAMLMATQSDLNTVTIPESVASGLPVLTNDVPLLSRWVDEQGVGRCRPDWTADDMAYMVAGRDDMHRRCVAIRDTLTTHACVDNLIACAHAAGLI